MRAHLEHIRRVSFSKPIAVKLSVAASSSFSYFKMFLPRAIFYFSATASLPTRSNFYIFLYLSSLFILLISFSFFSLLPLSIFLFTIYPRQYFRISHRPEKKIRSSSFHRELCNSNLVTDVSFHVFKMMKWDRYISIYLCISYFLLLPFTNYNRSNNIRHPSCAFNR